MEELFTILLKEDIPSSYFQYNLDKELEDLKGVEQNPKFHKEGDVWIHTMMVLDQGVQFREKVENPLGFMLACLCHDFGKVITTERINGEIHSYQHEIKGLPIVKSFLLKYTDDQDLIDYVLNLVKHHMRPNTMAANHSSIKKTNHLFDECIDPLALVYLALCDSFGQITEMGPINNEDFLMERLHIYKETMAKPYVTKDDLDNPSIEVLEYAHKLRLAGIDKDTALKQIKSYKRK